MNPLVTCVCLTKNRREWLPTAIQCFLDQTYSERQLLIINDGEDQIHDLIPADERIVLPVIDRTLMGHTLGEKRNAACECAEGDILAIWDDDDYSAPDRLTDQVRRLEETAKAVTAYHTMKFTDGERWWMYEGTVAIGIGSSLCFRKEFWEAHPFPALQIAEDNGFVYQARQANEFIAVPAGELMYATIHPKNTSKRDLAGYRLLN